MKSHTVSFTFPSNYNICNMLAIAFVLMVIYRCQNALAQVGMGPINVDIISASPCEGDQGHVKMDVVSLDGNKKGINFDINIDFEIDETISYTARVDKVQNGQIQEGVFRHAGDYACEDFGKFLGDIWQKCTIAMGMPEGCPIPAGHYNVEKFPFDDKDIGVKTFLYGRFLLNVELAKSGEKFVCQVVEFTNNRPGESV